MDLSDADIRRQTIINLFAEESGLGQRNFLASPAEVLSPLWAPGNDWGDSLAEVDEARLRAALRSIAHILDDPDRPRIGITRTDIEVAKSKSNCHYLWFC